MAHMAQAAKLVLDPGETVEQRIDSILAIMSEKVSDEDRSVLQRMLEQALDMKKTQGSGQTFADLRSKYVATQKNEEIINIEDSPEPKKTKGGARKPQRPEKDSSKLKGQTKKGTATPSKDEPKKLKGPPTKRKAPEPSPQVSDEQESDYEPVDSDASSDDAFVKSTPKRKPKAVVKGSAKKKASLGSRPPLSWCSSESEVEIKDGVPKKKAVVVFTEEELKAMYDTAMDDPDILPGKNVKGMSNADKNKRRRKLFIKIKQNVNAVGGNKRRKKSLFYKFTDHKNRTKDKHRILVNKYGKSGASKMPENEALTPMEIRCLDFWGVEASGFVAGAIQTQMDVDSSDGTDNEAVKMRKAEKEADTMEKEYKAKLKVQESTKKSVLDALRERYKMGPSSSTAIEVREPAADIRAQVEKHKPARRVTTKKSRIAVFKNSEDDADDDDEDEGDDSLPKHVDTTPRTGKPPSSRVTRSSERLASKEKGTETTKAKPSSDTKRALVPDLGEDDSQQMCIGSLPDLSDDNIDRTDMDEGMDFSGHLKDDDRVEGQRSSHVQSFKVGEAPTEPTTSSTPRTAQGRLTGPVSSEDPSTVKPTLVSTTDQTVGQASASVPEKDQQSDDLQVAFIHSEISCVREHIQKMHRLPDQVKLIGNSVNAVHGDISTIGANCVTVKAEVNSIADGLRDTDKVVRDVKTHILGLHAESSNLKGDLHGLKTKTVELRVVSQGAKEELCAARVEIGSVAGDVGMLKEDVTSVEGKINVLQQDMSHIKHEMGLMKSNVCTMRHDLAAVKTTVNNIYMGIAEIKSALLSRCDKTDKQVGTDVNVEVKSDPGTPHAAPPETQETPERVDLSGISSMNTSEVQFKPSAAFITYAKQQNRKEKVVGQCVTVDSEIDAIADTERDTARSPMPAFQIDREEEVSLELLAEETQETQDTQETQPEDSQEDPPLSQDPLSQEDASQAEPSQHILHVVNPPRNPTIIPEASGLQWPQHYQVAVGEEVVDPSKYHPLTVVSQEQVDAEGNKYYVVPEDIVQQLQEGESKSTGSPTKRASRRKQSKKK